MAVTPLDDRHRHRGAAQPGEGHQLEVLVGEVGVVEQAGEEVGGAAAAPRGPRSPSAGGPRPGPTRRPG